MGPGIFGWPVGSEGAASGISVVTSSGDFIIPAGVKVVTAYLVGGGGGGSFSLSNGSDGGTTSISYNGETVTAPGGSGGDFSGIDGLGGVIGVKADVSIAGQDGSRGISQGGSAAGGFGFGGNSSNRLGRSYGGGGAGSSTTYGSGGGGSLSIKRLTVSGQSRTIKCVVGAGGTSSGNDYDGADGVIVFMYTAVSD